MNKRERCLKTFDHDEPDKVPIHYLGFEHTGTAFIDFAESDIAEEYCTILPEVGDITEWRFLNVDMRQGDPFNSVSIRTPPPPPEYPGHTLGLNGSLSKRVFREKTKVYYGWYVGGYFRTKETLMKYWNEYGKPTEWFNEQEDYSAQKWEKYCKAAEPYFFPVATLGTSIWEATFEGMGLDRVAYYMRKDPEFIHFVMGQYADLNVEIIKGLAEAGVEVCFFFDDLGQKERGLLSLKNFREFLLPEYKKMYQAAKKRGIIFIQHSCGNMLEYLSDMVDAGLDAIQALEPASGIDIKEVKEKYGDRLTLIGGMDSSATLNFGTPKDIEENVKYCIKHAAPNGGYFAGPSHNIMDVPWENLLAFRAAIEKYRDYPINIGEVNWSLPD